MKWRSLVVISTFVLLIACNDTTSKKVALKPTKRTESTTVYPNGVSITRFEENGKQGAVGVDASEGGAVLCAREMYIGFLGPLTHCLRNSSPALVSEIKRSIERIDDFIVENSPDPVDREELRKNTAEQLVHSVLLAKQNPDKYCGAMVQQARQKFPHRTSNDWALEIKKSTDKILAEPRVPVMNPCL